MSAISLIVTILAVVFHGLTYVVHQLGIEPSRVGNLPIGRYKCPVSPRDWWKVPEKIGTVFGFVLSEVTVSITAGVS
jgi:hypothetical protein